jgi:hypothetical protein
VISCTSGPPRTMSLPLFRLGHLAATWSRSAVAGSESATVDVSGHAVSRGCAVPAGALYYGERGACRVSRYGISPWLPACGLSLHSRMPAARYQRRVKPHTVRLPGPRPCPTGLDIRHSEVTG